MAMTLHPDPDMGRIVVKLGDERRWSLLTPETVAAREQCFTHCHVRQPNWVQTSDGWILEQSLDDSRLRFECWLAVVDAETLELTFALFNDGAAPVTDAEADFCFSCAGGAWNTQAEHIARSWVNRPFHGPRKEFNTNWTKRSFVPTQAGLRAVGDINVHFPVPPNRAVAGQNIADFPIIMCQSEDRSEVYAAGWDRCCRLFCAIGSCIHTVVWLGTVAPGESTTRRGRFYYMEADPYAVLERFQRDFGLA